MVVLRSPSKQNFPLRSRENLENDMVRETSFLSLGHREVVFGRKDSGDYILTFGQCPESRNGHLCYLSSSTSSFSLIKEA